MTLAIERFLASALAMTLLAGGCAAWAAGPDRSASDLVSDVVDPLMTEHGIPGMAVGIVTPQGREILTFGVASKDTGTPVTPDTLFEVGSVSKSLTATLATYAEVKGAWKLSDSVTTHVPELKGSALDRVSLLNLATHTSGGMPLQFPGTVTNDAELMAYYRNWTPEEEPGSSRTYANPSIGLLGLATARAMEADFTELMEGMLYPALGLTSTFLDVPEGERANYAQGYTKTDAPIRMSPGILDRQAYGVRTTIGDLTRFVEANMGRVELDADLEKALAATHVGHYRLGAMTQAPIWEFYDYPVDLGDLIAGNSSEVAYKANPVAAISPPAAAGQDVWINKTGSTNGFGAYVAFVPGKELGIVLLANKNYPNKARVTAAHEILTSLAGSAPPAD